MRCYCERSFISGNSAFTVLNFTLRMIWLGVLYMKDLARFLARRERFWLRTAIVGSPSVSPPVVSVRRLCVLLVCGARCALRCTVTWRSYS